MSCRLPCIFRERAAAIFGGILVRLIFFSLHSFASIFAKERSRKKKRFKFDDGVAAVASSSGRDRTGIDFVKEREKAQKNRFSILIFRAIAIESQISSRP